MGNLSEDMKRLHREINSLHANRKAFINGIASEVENLRNSVLSMQSGFHKAHINRMQETKAGLSDFVADLKHTVAGLRADISTDILNTRRIWSGSSHPEHSPRPNIKIHITPHVKEAAPENGKAKKSPNIKGKRNKKNN